MKFIFNHQIAICIGISINVYTFQYFSVTERLFRPPLSASCEQILFKLDQISLFNLFCDNSRHMTISTFLIENIHV